MLTVAEVADAAALVGYREDWDALATAASTGSFFETYAWLSNFLVSFWQPRQSAFMFVREDGALVGVVPFLVDPDGDAWCRHTLTLPEHSHFPLANILTADGARPRVLDAVMRHVLQTRGPTSMVFTRVDRASALWSDLAASMERLNLTWHRWEGESIPWIRVTGTWDSYLATRTAHTRSELRRKRRKIEKAGHVAFSVASTPDECETALHDIMDIERNSWKEQEGTSFNNEPGAGPFYTAVARDAAASGALRLYVLYLDGKPVAHIHGVVYKNDYLAIKTSYNESYRELSPGSVLFEYALRDAFERGFASFDLLGVEARWKNELATDLRARSTACVFPSLSIRCRSCRTYECTLKPYLKEHAGWLATVKRRVVAGST